MGFYLLPEGVIYAVCVGGPQFVCVVTSGPYGMVGG